MSRYEVRAGQFALASVLCLCFWCAQGCSAEPTEPEWTPLTDAEYEQQRRESAAEMAENLGIKNPPEVEIVRFVDWDESAQVREECLAEAGFVSAGGGMYDVDEAQWDAYVLANYVCTFQYPYPREYSRPWGVEQKRAQYRWTVNFLIPCLEKEGYEVSQEAPTEQTFIDTWETDNTYYPYNYITIPHDANYNVEQERLNRVCLQVGVGSVIFGDETIEEWKARTGR